MTDLPPEPPPDPTSETQVHIPEFKREGSGGLPWLGIIVIAILALLGIGLIAFALLYGQGESENRAINLTVAAVMVSTGTPGDPRLTTSTSVPTVLASPTETASPVPPTDTPPPAATATFTVTVTNTSRATQAFVAPSATPVPPTNTPAPPPSSHGITGQLTLCNPEKPSFAASIERVCFRERIVNSTGNTITYGVLGVQIASLSGGPNSFHTSWQGNLSIGPGCTGPTDTCGGPWEDGTFLATPGTYRLSLSICYSDINTCLGSSGDWETLTSGVDITVISWTPSP
jgi:hypothetical protein